MLRLMIALGVLLWLSASLGCVKEQPAVELTTAELITYTSEGDVLRVTIDETATRIRGVFRQSSTALRKYGSRHFNAPYEAEYLEQLEGVFTKFGVKYEVVK
jgi:hypothetical protein